MTAEDLVIRDLADGEAVAWARVDALIAENAALRELLSESMGQGFTLTGHLEVARRTIAVLREAERRTAPPIRAAA
jgi:hypothetical protein